MQGSSIDPDAVEVDRALAIAAVPIVMAFASIAVAVPPIVVVPVVIVVGPCVSDLAPIVSDRHLHLSRGAVARIVRAPHGDRVHAAVTMARPLGAQLDLEIVDDPPVRRRVAVALAVDRLVAGGRVTP